MQSPFSCTQKKPQDSLGSTSPGKVSRLRPTEKIGFKFGTIQNKSLLFLSHCRWAVFAKWNTSSPIRDLHESILSYQCVCRAETGIA